MSSRSPTARRWFAQWVGVWTLVGFAVRAGYVLVADRHRTLAGDPGYFHGLAQMLRDGHGWINPYWYGYLIGKFPTATHPPLYPLLLAGSSFVGFDSALGHRLFSCLIGAAAIPLIAVVTRRYGTARAGVIAAAFAALYPYLWVNDVNLFSEALLAVLIAVVLVLAERVAREPTMMAGALLGMAIAACALTRGEEILLLPLLALPLLTRNAGSWRAALRRVATATAACLVVLAPWVGWNLSRFDHPVFISTDFGETLYNTNCDAVWFGSHIGWWQFQPPCPNDVPSNITEESVRDQRHRDIAWRYVRAHLSQAPIVVAARVGRVWGLFNPRQTRALDERAVGAEWPTRIGLVAFYPLLAMSAVGFQYVRRRGQAVYPFIALALLVTITAALFYGTPRFRTPAEVGVVVLAAVGVDSLIRRRATPAQK